MRKLKLPLLGLALLAVCAAAFFCRPGEDLLSGADDVLYLAVYDGETTTYWSLYDDTQEQALLAALSDAVGKRRVSDWTPEQVTLPVCGLTLGAGGETMELAWSNGYWITPEGEVRRGELLELEAYAWEDPRSCASTAGLPCAALLCRRGDSWRTDMLPPAEPLTEAEGLTLTAAGLTEGVLHTRLRNETGEEALYGEGFTLQVLLDGLWRDVPVRNARMFNLLGYPLPAGETAEVDFDIGDVYGSLPAGHYRLVQDDIAAEFDV